MGGSWRTSAAGPGSARLTYLNWKSNMRGMAPPAMPRLKQLEDENAKPRKLLADLSREREMPAGRHPQKNVRLDRKRELVDVVRSEWQMSIGRACAVIEMDTWTYHYKPH